MILNVSAREWEKRIGVKKVKKHLGDPARASVNSGEL